MDGKAYLIDDCGLVIGLVSAPTKNKTSIKEFYEKEICHNLSKKYKKAREKNYKGEAPSDQNLYHPVAFRMFSDYDIVVLTLMDDLSYPYRIFYPLHGSREEDNTYYNYDYQIMTCLNTFPEGSGNLRLKNILTGQRNEKYPYICITRTQLNSNFLVGNGMDYVELVKNTIREETNEYNDKAKRDVIKTYIFDSLGSEEMIIINFARNFSSIAELVQKTRCLLFSALSKGNHPEAYQKVLNNPIDPKKENVDWSKSHVFGSAYSLTGYSIDLVENFDSYEFVDEDKNKRIEIVFDWDIKPGHPLLFKEQFEGQMTEFKNTYPGFIYKEEQDFMRIEHNYGNYVRCMPTTILDDELKTYFERIETLRTLDKNKKHIRKLHIGMNIKFVDDQGKDSVAEANEFLSENCEKFELEKHPENSLIGEGIRIEREELSSLRNNLIRANFSKMLRERVMKMYNNYNHCINDPLFAGSFIDFYGFMKSFARFIEKYAKDELKEPNANSFQTWITDCVDGFEQAYYNRFHQSARMRNMPDFNIEWNGSLQQIISPLDGYFKEMLFLMGNRHYHKFIFISGLYGAEIRENTLRINMLYVTYPELFVATIWKEIFNFHLTSVSVRMEEKENPLSQFKKDEYLIHLNRSISNYKDYDASNTVHQYLFDYLINNKEAMTTYIADSLTFLCGYLRDYNLFSYWYWKVFLQTSLYYDKSGKFDSKIFIRCLSRIIFVRLLHGEDPEDLRFKPFDPSVSGLWIMYFEDVLSYTKVLFEVLNWSHFCEKLKGYVLVMHTEQLEVDEQEENKQKWDQVYNEKCNQEINLILDNFKEDKISYPSGSKELFINSLAIAFLKYIKELTGNVESNIQVLIRNNKGGIDNHYKEENVNPILSDMQGGMFCVDSEVQKSIFKVRALFYRAIFHYTEKYTKLNIIKLKPIINKISAE